MNYVCEPHISKRELKNLPEDLAEVVSIRDTLPEHIKKAILSLINSVKKNG
jgi:flagellar motor switch protein FliG